MLGWLRLMKVTIITSLDIARELCFLNKVENCFSKLIIGGDRSAGHCNAPLCTIYYDNHDNILRDHHSWSDKFYAGRNNLL